MDPRDGVVKFEGKADDLHNPHLSGYDDYEERPQPFNGDDGASPGKIFIGGLARETTSAQFVKHFGRYGEIIDSVIMKDRKTGQPRGFGFITYADPSVVDKVIQDSHVINGKQVEIKRTIPKGAVGAKDFRTKKIFVGGLPTSVNEDEFKDFFSSFGEVKEHQIMRDHSTNRSRGFGFVTFNTEEAVDDLLSRGNKIDFAGTKVEIKKAEPKKASAPPSSRRYSDSKSGYGGGFGDSYGGYGGGGGGFGAGPFRGGGAYGGRASAYSGYGGSEFGGFGGYAGSGIGAYRGDPSSYGYSGRYGGSFSRGYDMGSAYGGAAEGYGGYGAAAAGGAAAAATGSYGSGYDSGLGGGSGYGVGGGGYGGGSSYGGGASGNSMYGSGRGGGGGYGGAGAGSGRYHPYAR